MFEKSPCSVLHKDIIYNMYLLKSFDKPMHLLFIWRHNYVIKRKLFLMLTIIIPNTYITIRLITTRQLLLQKSIIQNEV